MTRKFNIRENEIIPVFSGPCLCELASIEYVST